MQPSASLANTEGYIVRFILWLTTVVAGSLVAEGYGGIAVPAVHGVSCLVGWGSWLLSSDLGMEWFEGPGIVWREENGLERERNRAYRKSREWLYLKLVYRERRWIHGKS
jgi:hypothetical protein